VKRLNIISILLILGLAFTYSCVDPFNPPRENYEELLVVEAFISDDDTAQLVRLSISSPIDLSEFLPQVGATVVVEEVGGQTYIFRESSDGDYLSDVNEFKPTIGNSYVLRITLPDGTRFSSKPVVMKETAPLKDLYFRQTSFISQISESREEGFEILIDTEAQGDEPAYFRYEWDETYQLSAPNTTFLDYDFETQDIFPREELISVCWRDRISRATNVITTEGLTTTEINEHPILFIPFNDPALKERYSIEVRQYAIDRDGYRFWTELKESNELTGSLFDTQPYPLVGNLVNETNPEIPVLGYFDVASVSSERIFIDNSDVPREFVVPSFFDRCLTEAGDTATTNIEVIENLVSNQYVILRNEIGVGYILVIRPCADCTNLGTNVKPSFWID